MRVKKVAPRNEHTNESLYKGTKLYPSMWVQKLYPDLRLQKLYPYTMKQIMKGIHLGDAKNISLDVPWLPEYKLQTLQNK